MVAAKRLNHKGHEAHGGFSEWHAPNDAYAPLSFDRPEIANSVPGNAHVLDPVPGRLASSLAPAEWRLLGWLEREGFAYDLYADAQLHDGTLDLDAYAVLILGVHPEYWSRTMFERVKSWVDERGGKLMYLGGNGLNCEVEFLDSATMRCKTQLLSSDGSLGMRDPQRPDVYFESRFHATVAPEASLLGVVTTDAGIMTAAPYRVVKADHWVFEGTGLQNGDIFGAQSLHERCPGGASGHETDKMSASSPAGTDLLAKGLNPDNGGAEMASYTTSSGGSVFSVGSITWPLALLVDPHVSCITSNVIHRFLG
ncbi:N,N-dimethylformamidase beta subunit family domain-containing protein [Roseiflexus castenholzii]|uniref:N,N-dimethylformamidase beta subunit family domain-containing protein n=1 Tax=Roseiflexus castenholzii TaxID=120962 RepID=UPI003C7B7BA5